MKKIKGHFWLPSNPSTRQPVNPSNESGQKAWEPGGFGEKATYRHTPKLIFLQDPSTFNVFLWWPFSRDITTKFLSNFDRTKRKIANSDILDFYKRFGTYSGLRYYFQDAHFRVIHFYRYKRLPHYIWWGHRGLWLGDIGEEWEMVLGAGELT